MPRGELRRKDRGITGAESEGLLERALVGRIGTVDQDGWPYVVPMNFVYEPGSAAVYLHCAPSGHLLDNLAANSMACFEVDDPGDVIATGPAGCDTSHVYTSVVCFGRAAAVDDQQEKERALTLFVQKYVDRLSPQRQYASGLDPLDTTEVIAFRIEKMTGKARRPT